MANAVRSEFMVPQPARLSWTALWSGMFVAVGVELTLSVLAVAVGFTAANPSSGGQAWGIGFGIWFIVQTLIALFFGAWVASSASLRQRSSDGVLHGLATWGWFWLIFAIVAIGGALLGKSSAAPAAAQATGTTSNQLLATAGVAWGSFIAMVVSLLTSLLGGALGAGSVRRRILNPKPYEREVVEASRTTRMTTPPEPQPA